MVDAFCKTWKLTKPPQDEAARIALSNSWGTGCSKPAAECQEVPTFRLKKSCKNKAQYYLIQRRGSKRNVIGPVTMDGKPSVIKRNCCFLFMSKEYDYRFFSVYPYVMHPPVTALVVDAFPFTCKIFTSFCIHLQDVLKVFRFSKFLFGSSPAFAWDCNFFDD